MRGKLRHSGSARERGSETESSPIPNKGLDKTTEPSSFIPVYSYYAHSTLPPRQCEPSLSVFLREMSGIDPVEPRQREEVSLGKCCCCCCHNDPDTILLYSLDRKKFDAKYGQITEKKTSGRGTKVKLRSDSGCTYKVTRNGKEDYSTGWRTWKKVETVSY